jgi:class 3 adenylate cyclase
MRIATFFSISLGETPELSESDRRKLHIVNGNAYLTIIIFFIYQIYFIAIGLYQALPVSVMGILLMVVPIILNAQKKHYASRVAFMFAGYFLFTLMCVMYGKRSSVEYALLVATILAQFLFDNKKVVLSFVLLGLGLFMYFQLYHYVYYKGWYEHLVTDIIFFMNIISLFLVTYLIVKQFKYENELYQKIILQQNQEIEQQRQKSENLLLNILPEETADELKEKGFATPKHYDLVTVLFTDFKGFTQIAEKITPQEVIENLNTCFLAFDEICEKYGLEKIKTIGDSYMCAGGVPTPNTTNPVDVVLAGLAMQAWMAQWAEKKRVKGEPSWELRLGIHSGEAVAGVVGKNKFAYDIWGDTVNLASRMESSGEVGKVNISDTTYALIKHRFQCVHRGEIQAKNKGKIEMYFVEKHL